MVLSAELIRRLRSFREAEFGRGATPQEIELAEEQLGVGLPVSYKALLGTSAGPASKAWKSMVSGRTFPVVICSELPTSNEGSSLTYHSANPR
jgi:hypothetical protein